MNKQSIQQYLDAWDNGLPDAIKRDMVNTLLLEVSVLEARCLLYENQLTSALQAGEYARWQIINGGQK